MKKFEMMAIAVLAAFTVAAMPSETELEKANKDVQTVLKTHIAAWQKGDIGNDDLAVVRVDLQEAGFTMNAYLFDTDGRLVRHLVRGALMGKEGSFVWNGLDDHGNRVPLGVYVLVTEAYNSEGKVLRQRTAVAVASR